jgi:hypothetical protein
MRNAQLFLRLLVISLIFFTACKDKDDDPKPPTRTDILTAKTWKMNRVLGNGIDITNQPFVSEFQDLRLKFEPDKTYTLTSPDGSQTGTWAFADNETKLVFDPNTADADTWEIVELIDNSAKLRSSQDVPPFGQVAITLELVPE